ncbi:MAG: response regulator transcription factor [Hahellaceae bacterium]|nr:response regulator transcription factor [Hahellaceae bacterium]
MRILLIEDESKLRQQLTEALQGKGYAVDTAADGVEGLHLGQEAPYDLAIVDLGLPQMDGLEVIRQWRSRGVTMPVLILTARGHWQERVNGLESGADDYLVKPFHLAELQARVHALIRRSSGLPSSVLEAGPMRLDTSARSLQVRAQLIELTAFEYNTLEYLMRRAGQTVSKAELTEHLYAQDFDRDSNVIEVFMGRLRKKIDPDGALQPIVTQRGLGYRFNLAVKPA